MPNDIGLTLEQIQNLIDKYGSPLYVYDEDAIRKNAKNFMSTFRKYIPNFRQYFAVKALPNGEILKLLYKEGMGFDCSSITELEMVRKISTKNDDIMFSSNYTSVKDLAYALALGDNIIINLDDIDGIDNMVEAMFTYQSMNLRLPKLICFRLNPGIGNTNSETKSNILGGAHTKFGIPDSKIINAYRVAKDLGIKKFGIHVMTGSCILDVNYWKELINILFENISNIVSELGITFEFVNLGGGIGIPYKPDIPLINLDELAMTIAVAINNNIKKYKLTFNPEIFMENGRYITGPYGWLISQCQSIKIGYNDRKFFGLDACMANLMRPGMYGAYHHITIPRLIDESNLEEANVVGTLCENNDWFAKDRKLPQGIVKKDIFIIHDVGAHGHCMGFQYNGKLRSPEVLMSKDSKNDIINSRLIRKGETIADFLLH